MGKTWVLRTDTKGTGAQMVPLESTEQRPGAVEPVWVRREPSRSAPAAAPQPPAPRRFRIVDVMTRQTLAEDASAREAVDALRDVRSPVDVSVYVRRSEGDRWRALAMPERRTLWELSRRSDHPG